MGHVAWRAGGGFPSGKVYTPRASRPAREMSETETVNILPGPHGERLRVGLEELESREPLLEGCAGNGRREGIIKRARAELDGRRGDAGYERALELLDMLTPTSSHATWCRLYGELRGLKDNAAYLVGPECELVRIDTLQGIKSDAELVPKLHEECSRFVEDGWSRLSDFERYLEDMMGRVDRGAKGGERTRRYIVDMARFGSGVDDGLILRVILVMYVEPGMYREACAVCEEIVGFEGEDKARMAGSTLVESVMDSLLIRLSESYDPGRDGGLAQKCVDLLATRAKDLGTIRPMGQGTLLHKASRLVSNMRARRRLRTAGEIGAWIGGKYRLSCDFLGLDDRKVRDILETNADLVENASIRMQCDEMARARRLPPVTGGVLDELERLIPLMRKNGIDTGRGSRQWKGDMRGTALWRALSEARIYMRLRLAGRSVKARPGIEDGEKTDLLVDGCQVEVFSPEDGTLLLSRQWLDEGMIAELAAEEIRKRPQLESAGGRAAVMVMDCPHSVLDSPKLRGKLDAAMGERPQLGGVLLIMFRGDHYASRFAKNPKAARPVPDATVDMIAGALGARL